MERISIKPKISENREYPAVDILKFIGALLVVAIHAAPFRVFGSLINHGFNNVLCRIAVPIYFTATGYFLFRKISQNNFDASVPVKYSRKILRLYGIWTIIYSPLIIRSLVIDKNLGTFLRNCIFSGTYDHLWYLGATVVGVLLVTLFIKLKINMRIITFISLILYIIGAIPETYTFISDYLYTIPKIGDIICFLSEFTITTRNGVFFGFPFILLGAVFAYKKIKLKSRYVKWGVALSLILLFIEALIVQYFHWAKDYNLYFSLLPTSFFIFHFALNVELEPKKIHKNLRVVGILMYFVHPIFIFFFGGVGNSLLKFILVVVFSLIFAECIYYLKSFNKFKFLCKLYS